MHNLQSCCHKSTDVHTSINEIQTGQKINCEAIQVISDSIVHITKAISQLREDVEKKQVNNKIENYSNPIQELLHNHNTNEIINEANETNISEVSNSNGKNETSTNKIDDADASNTPNFSERVAPHLNDPKGKYRQNDPTPKHLVTCPFLCKKGHCLKGSNFSHNIGPQQSLRFHQQQDRSSPFHKRTLHPYQILPPMKYPFYHPPRFYPYIHP